MDNKLRIEDQKRKGCHRAGMSKGTVLFHIVYDKDISRRVGIGLLLKDKLPGSSGA